MSFGTLGDADEITSTDPSPCPIAKRTDGSAFARHVRLWLFSEAGGMVAEAFSKDAFATLHVPLPVGAYRLVLDTGSQSWTQPVWVGPAGFNNEEIAVPFD